MAETRYVVDLTTAGCYEFHALSPVANEAYWENSFAINRKVWDPDPDTNVFHVDYRSQGGPSTMALGSCPASLP